MKSLIFFFAFFLIYGSAFAQPDPQRVPPHSRPKPPAAAEILPETEYIPLDAKAAPCQMTVANAPAIGGVKLGLTAEELGKAFKIKIIPGPPNKIDVSIFSIGEKNKSALPNGINSIVLAFYDNRLFHANIAFDNVSQKKPLDSFALSLSEKNNFSKAWFKTSRKIRVFNEPKMQTDDTEVFLFCPGEIRFTLSHSGDELQLEMLDLKADNQKNQHRKQTNTSKPQ